MKGWWKHKAPFGWGLIFVLVAPSLSAGESIEAVQKAATEWARVRAETVRAQTEWRWQKEFLESTLQALTERVHILEDRKDYLEATSARKRGSAAELGLRNKEALELLQKAKERVDSLSGGLIALRPWLPPRLSDALEFSFRSLGDPSLSVSERMQTVATVFNRCSRFNNTITYSEEMVVTEADRPPEFLSVLYWGLSHAYALDSSDGGAFLGSPGENGWTWEKKADLAPDVARLMAMYHDEQAPEFIEVPARLVDLTGGPGTDG